MTYELFFTFQVNTCLSKEVHLKKQILLASGFDVLFLVANWGSWGPYSICHIEYGAGFSFYGGPYTICRIKMDPVEYGTKSIFSGDPYSIGRIQNALQRTWTPRSKFIVHFL